MKKGKRKNNGILWGMIVWILALSVALSGCSSDSEPKETGDLQDTEQEQREDNGVKGPPANDRQPKDEAQPEEGDGQPSSEPPSDSTPPQITLEYIKGQIKQGQSKEEIEQIFGKNYHETFSAMDGGEIWRYDYPLQEGYVYSPDNEWDSVDLDGLKNGKMGMQLFVGWGPEGKVDYYSVAYKHPDGKIHVYYLLSNGEEKEDIVE